MAIIEVNYFDTWISWFSFINQGYVLLLLTPIICWVNICYRSKDSFYSMLLKRRIRIINIFLKKFIKSLFMNDHFCPDFLNLPSRISLGNPNLAYLLAISSSVIWSKS